MVDDFSIHCVLMCFNPANPAADYIPVSMAASSSSSSGFGWQKWHHRDIQFFLPVLSIDFIPCCRQRPSYSGR